MDSLQGAYGLAARASRRFTPQEFLAVIKRMMSAPLAVPSCVRVTVASDQNARVEDLSYLPPDSETEALMKLCQDSESSSLPVAATCDFAAPFCLAPADAIYEDTASLMYEDEVING